MAKSDKKLDIYLCGPTVYNSPHIGNMRPIMYLDIFTRVKRFLGYEVKFVHNITDIDDKIIQKSIEENTTEIIISNKYYNEYIELLNQFNIDINNLTLVKVTDNLDVITNFISKLENKNITYESKNNIFLSVDKILEYGQVSNQNLNQMKTNEFVAEGKKYFADFALWKNTDQGIQFKYQNLLGRPGWHTECAAFIDNSFKGNTIDIHAGGIDLKFPHHENENAQFLGLYNIPITKKWLWTGLINIENSKMSKSLNNFITAQDFLNLYSADLFRIIILTTSSSSIINIEDTLINEKQKILNKYIKVYKQFILENKNIANVDENLLYDVLEKYSNDQISLANKIINEKISDKNSHSTLIKIWKILGFNFATQSISVNLYKTYELWKQTLEKKEFEKADKLREILIKNNVI